MTEETYIQAQKLFLEICDAKQRMRKLSNLREDFTSEAFNYKTLLKLLITPEAPQLCPEEQLKNVICDWIDAGVAECEEQLTVLRKELELL